MKNTKEFLNRGFQLYKIVEQKSKQIQHLRQMLERLAPIMTDMPKSQSPDTSPTETKLVTIVDLQTEIKSLVENIAKISCETSIIINGIADVRQREVLSKRYIEFKQWTDISIEMHISYHYVHNLHRRGLDAVKKIIQNRTVSTQNNSKSHTRST